MTSSLRKKPIKLVPDPDGECLEYCCFCFKHAAFWVPEKDVCCCKDCAAKRTLEEVPTKDDWCRSVELLRIARIEMGRPFLRERRESDLDYARKCVKLGLQGAGVSDALVIAESIKMLIRAVLDEAENRELRERDC